MPFGALAVESMIIDTTTPANLVEGIEQID